MKGAVEYDKDPKALTNDLERGDESAFDYLFTTRYESLCRFAHAFVGSYDVAEDIVQDVFVKIWENNLKINGTSLDSYLYVAVRNGCVSYARRVKPNVGLKALEKYEVEEVSIEDRKFVWEAVEVLPERCRLILKLVVLEDMKYADVAERLNISINTVKGQMKIAYRELRKKFSKDQVALLFCIFRLNLRALH